jgi:hypothetical protein
MAFWEPCGRILAMPPALSAAASVRPIIWSYGEEGGEQAGCRNWRPGRPAVRPQQPSDRFRSFPQSRRRSPAPHGPQRSRLYGDAISVFR